MKIKMFLYSKHIFTVLLFIIAAKFSGGSGPKMLKRFYNAAMAD